MFRCSSGLSSHFRRCTSIRHIAFGKHVVDTFFETGSAKIIDTIRSRFGVFYKNLKTEVIYNPEIYLHTSFPFPIHPEDKEEIERARNSENNQRMNAERFAEVDQWFTKLGIIEA